MFNKKPLKASVLANGSDDNGLRYGGGNYKSSLDMSKLGLERYKTREGLNKMDIIPFNAGPKHPLVVAGKCEEGDTVYSLDYFVHKGIGPNGDDFTCLKQFGCRCPLCEESKRYYDKGTEDDKKKGAALLSKRRVVYLIHDLTDNKYYYWDTGWNLFEKPVNDKASITNDPKTGATVNPFDWEVGKTISFKAVKDTFNGNTFNKLSEATLTFEDRAPLSDEVLNHSVDLSEAIVMPTEAEMDAALVGKVIATDKPAQTASANTSAAPDAKAQPGYNDMDNVTTTQPESTPTSDLASQALQSQAQTAPAPEPTPAQSAPAASPDRTCPCGYDWGTADDHPECKSCKVWDKCIDG